MKEQGHTNKPDCCAACEQFYKNYVETGKARVPTPEELNLLAPLALEA